MNRKIQFRGKRKDNGEWVYGDLLNLTRDFKKVHEIIDWRTENFKNVVISETVGQYTGLKDKKGKKIFEGDIIKYFEPYKSTFNTQDVFGTEPQNSWIETEFTIYDYKGTVSLKDGSFGVLSGKEFISFSVILKCFPYDFVNDALSEGLIGEDNSDIIEILSFVLNEDENKEIFDRLNNESDFDKFIKYFEEVLETKVFNQFEVIGNIYENPE